MPCGARALDAPCIPFHHVGLVEHPRIEPGAERLSDARGRPDLRAPRELVPPAGIEPARHKGSRVTAGWAHHLTNDGMKRMVGGQGIEPYSSLLVGQMPSPDGAPPTWSEQLDSNQRSPAPEAGALARLSYARGSAAWSFFVALGPFRATPTCGAVAAARFELAPVPV